MPSVRESGEDGDNAAWSVLRQEGFPGGSDDEESTCGAGDPGSVPGREDPLEKGVAAHSSILAPEDSWTDTVLSSHYVCP